MRKEKLEFFKDGKQGWELWRVGVIKMELASLISLKFCFVFKIQIFHVPVSFVSTHNLWSYFPEDVPQPDFSIVLNKRGSLFSGGLGLEMKQKCPGLRIGLRLATAEDHTQGRGAWKAVATPSLWGSRTGHQMCLHGVSLSGFRGLNRRRLCSLAFWTWNLLSIEIVAKHT